MSSLPAAIVRRNELPAPAAILGGMDGRLGSACDATLQMSGRLPCAKPTQSSELLEF